MRRSRSAAQRAPGVKPSAGRVRQDGRRPRGACRAARLAPLPPTREVPTRSASHCAVLPHAVLCRHPGELIFGAALLYYTRLFERQFGSAKYGSFVLTACGISYLLEVAAASLLGLPSASGPYPIIFASLVSFVLDVPPLHRLNVFGWRATDKVCALGRGLCARAHV